MIYDMCTLLWNEFSISMTIGDTERVPFVSHGHFVEEWESVGRILIKGFESVSYFPTFLSKEFLCHCLFGNQVPDSIFFDSFSTNLSPLEEGLILDVMINNELPDDEDELNDFLERYQRRKVVNNKNISKVTLKISKQELVQKPHLTIVPLHSFAKQLPNNSQSQSVPVIEVLYESRKPTVKKVLSCFMSNPCSEGERDAFTFLQRFVRGMEIQNLVHFSRFTTGMDIMVGKKIEVGFIKCEGVASSLLPTLVDRFWIFLQHLLTTQNLTGITGKWTLSNFIITTTVFPNVSREVYYYITHWFISTKSKEYCQS